MGAAKNIFTIRLFEPKQNLIDLALTYFVTANYTISCEALKADTAHGSSWCC